VRAAYVGDHSDGDGLYLRVKAGRRSREATASWVFRYTSPSGKRRELGLGAADRGTQEAAGASLRRARRKAEVARAMLDEIPPRDPIDVKAGERRAAREAASAKKAASKSAATTLRRYARAYHAAQVEPIRANRHGKEWLGGIERHIPAALLDRPIAAVTSIDLLDALVPVLRKVPETGSRISQRLATVFDAAVIAGLRPDNPATPIRRELRKRAGRRVCGNYASMPYQRMRGFATDLRAMAGNSPRCLEFAILTAARTGEALMAEWSEFDLQARIWTIPASRMKGREQHVVYLCERAVVIVECQKGQNARYVFPSPAGRDAPMSNMSMLTLLRRMGLWSKDAPDRVTVHGFRATFSTWANELGIARPDVIEAALAHSEADRVRRAYNRSHFLNDRRLLMTAWGEYLAGREVTRADGSIVANAEIFQFPAPQRASPTLPLTVGTRLDRLGAETSPM
jgi:integrase